MKRQPVPSALFTGRTAFLGTIEQYFSKRDHGLRPRREFLLHGMGGAGKTQLALKFAENYADRCV